MKTIYSIIISLCLIVASLLAHGNTATTYLAELEQYRQLKNHIHPDNYDLIIEFIDNNNTEHANKLRRLWLSHLAKRRNWSTFYNHYKEPTNLSLKCHYIKTLIMYDNREKAYKALKPIWLSAKTRPSSCKQIFDPWISDESFDEQLIYQRLELALETKNLTLARYLFTKLGDNDYLFILKNLHRNPSKINSLKLSNKKIESMLILYGLKRMTVKKINQSINLWQKNDLKEKLKHKQKQSYLKHLTLYMALRDHPRINEWFDKIDSKFYTHPHMEWQIRANLKRKNWHRVKKLIARYKNKNKPCWQYWYARALEQTDESDKANAIYATLANKRHYYGFLASHRLKIKLSFEDDSHSIMNVDISQYESIIDTIKKHYTEKRKYRAAIHLNDLILGLSDHEIRQVAKELSEVKWHSRTIYLLNNTKLKNDLNLRFPLAYKEIINLHATRYRVPQEFVFAIIRQESTFRHDVVSSAGARGLMQVMPTTASRVARRHAISYSHKNQLFHPHTNIKIGTAYLKHLAKRFDNHPILVAAAYNAGPRQVRYWLKKHKAKQVDIWIETLPWRETRNYLKNVTSFYAVYQYRIKGKSTIKKVLKDIHV
jgi:peptidoglycan lytic transglycosylase